MLNIITTTIINILRCQSAALPYVEVSISVCEESVLVVTPAPICQNRSQDFMLITQTQKIHIIYRYDLFKPYFSFCQIYLSSCKSRFLLGPKGSLQTLSYYIVHKIYCYDLMSELARWVWV